MLFKEEVEEVSSALLLARSVPSRDCPVRSRSLPAGAGSAQGFGAPAGQGGWTGKKAALARGGLVFGRGFQDALQRGG